MREGNKDHAHPTFKDFNKNEKLAAERRKEEQRRLKERLEDKKETMKTPVPKFPEPIPQDRRTFSAIAKRTKKNPPKPRGPKGPHFGKADRFNMDAQAKYSKQIKLFNAADIGRTLDAKSNPVPGPG